MIDADVCSFRDGSRVPSSLDAAVPFVLRRDCRPGVLTLALRVENYFVGNERVSSYFTVGISTYQRWLVLGFLATRRRFLGGNVGKQNFETRVCKNEDLGSCRC